MSIAGNVERVSSTLGANFPAGVEYLDFLLKINVSHVEQGVPQLMSNAFQGRQATGKYGMKKLPLSDKENREENRAKMSVFDTGNREIKN